MGTQSPECSLRPKLVLNELPLYISCAFFFFFNTLVTSCPSELEVLRRKVIFKGVFTFSVYGVHRCPFCTLKSTFLPNKILKWSVLHYTLIELFHTETTSICFNRIKLWCASMRKWLNLVFVCFCLTIADGFSQVLGKSSESMFVDWSVKRFSKSKDYS